MLSFEWDERKNKTNQKKHGVSFEEASTVFLDERAILFDDPTHSEKEERCLLLDMSTSARVSIVCHCYRASELSSESFLPERQPRERKSVISFLIS